MKDIKCGQSIIRDIVIRNSALAKETGMKAIIEVTRIAIHNSKNISIEAKKDTNIFTKLFELMQNSIIKK